MFLIPIQHYTLTGYTYSILYKRCWFQPSDANEIIYYRIGQTSHQNPFYLNLLTVHLPTIPLLLVGAPAWWEARTPSQVNVEYIA